MARPAGRARLPRFVRIGLWSLLSLVALIIIGGAIFALTFDLDSQKPRIIATVKQATGRDLFILGHIRLGLSLQPTLVVQNVSLANPPGFSRPQMATLERLDLKLALLPLLSHHVEITRLVLVKPDVILETDAHGRGNWQFTPEAAPADRQPVEAGTDRGTPTQISASEVRIEDGTLTWHDGRSGRSAALELSSLRASAASPEADVHLVMAGSYHDTPFNLTGEFGSLTKLRTGTAWPARMHLEAAGAKLSLNGNVAQPLEGRGYAVKLDAAVPDVAALAPLLPGVALPALRDVTLAAQIADKGGPVPEVSGLALHAGASDLSQTVAGLKLDKLDVTAARFDQSAHIAAQGSYGDAPATLAGTIGAPAALLRGGKVGSTPIDVTVQALGSSLAIRGTAAQAEDGRPAILADVSAGTINLDTLKIPRAPAPTQPVAATAAPPTPRPAADNRLFPDTPIPFGVMRLADADLKLKIDQLIAGGATYRALVAHLDLQGGRLRLDSFAVDAPEGHVDAALSADAAQVALRLQAPKVAMQPLLAALGQPGYLAGTMQVQADLRGAGATPHAIASSLEGTVALAMGNGTVDNRLLGSTLGSVLREINLLDLVGRGGTSQVQCFALRIDASHGIAAVRSLALVSSMLTLDGSGSINLGAETLDLRLRPQGRVAGTSVVVPLRVSGPLRSPATVPDPAAAVAANAGTVAGGLLGNATPLGAVAGILGGQNLLGGAPPAAGCAVPGGQTGASGRAAPSPAQQRRPSDAGDILKQLFR